MKNSLKKKLLLENILYYEAEIEDLKQVIYNSKEEIKELQKKIEELKEK